jgi:hypothetical protein
VRWTACFRRIDGTWLVVHDHVSVPIDPLNRTGFIGGPILREDGPDAPSQQVLSRIA